MDKKSVEKFVDLQIQYKKSLLELLQGICSINVNRGIDNLTEIGEGTNEY